MHACFAGAGDTAHVRVFARDSGLCNRTRPRIEQIGSHHIVPLPLSTAKLTRLGICTYFAFERLSYQPLIVLRAATFRSTRIPAPAVCQESHTRRAVALSIQSLQRANGGRALRHSEFNSAIVWCEPRINCGSSSQVSQAGIVHVLCNDCALCSCFCDGNMTAA